jgi:hypothetical protein
MNGDRTQKIGTVPIFWTRGQTVEESATDMWQRVISVVVAGRTTSPDEAVARVRAQKVSAEIEIVVPDVVANLTRGELLDWGMCSTQGELVVLLDARALPADPRWLFHLVAPFADPQIEVAFAHCMSSRPERAALARALCFAVRREAWGERPIEAMRAAQAGAAVVYLDERPSTFSLLRGLLGSRAHG